MEEKSLKSLKKKFGFETVDCVKAAEGKMTSGRIRN